MTQFLCIGNIKAAEKSGAKTIAQNIKPNETINREGKSLEIEGGVVTSYLSGEAQGGLPRGMAHLFWDFLRAGIVEKSVLLRGTLDQMCGPEGGVGCEVRLSDRDPNEVGEYKKDWHFGHFSVLNCEHRSLV